MTDIVRVMFDRALDMDSRDMLELDMTAKQAYVKREGMNTQEIIRFRVIEDERSNKND